MFNEKINVYSSNHRSVVKDYGIADVEWVSGAAMVVSGEYISKHGLFDPNIFLYGEDEDLCIEAHARGYRVVLQNTDPVKHIHGWLGVNQYSVKVSQMKQRSLKYFIEKHFGRSASALLMRSLLPIYVNGWRNFLRNSISAYSKTY
jgi:GT2 family glycosyltransferase